MPRLIRLIVIGAMLIAGTTVRAQDALIGAPVYLYQPGFISSTLLAAPTSPDYRWGTSVIYWGRVVDGQASGVGLTNDTHAVGSIFTGVSNIPDQGGLPLVVKFSYTWLADIPAPTGSQPGDVQNYAVTTGLMPGNYQPFSLLKDGDGFVQVPASQTAAVVFGPDNTADIGFAPIGTSVDSFADYPVRIRLSNVFSGSSGAPGGGVGQVPEPGTLALTLAGLVGAGLLRRRKRVKHS